MHRNITYRLIPGTRNKAHKLSRTAGACRWVRNHFLAENQRQYHAHLDTQLFCEDTLLGLLFERPEKPSVSFFSLGKQFIELRRQMNWLRELPCATVRYTLKRQADAWRRAFADPRAGLPKFKARNGSDSFTIPQSVKVRSDAIAGVQRLWVPKIGWMVLRRRGGNPYAGCEPVQAVVKRVLGRWYCTVCYTVPEALIQPVDNGKAIGLDRNVGQVTVSNGRMFKLPDLSRLEARKRRYQRMMCRREKGSKRRALARHRCAKAHRKIAMIRANWQHHVSRALADTAGTVVIEALNTKGMTASARGTVIAPGKNVKTKTNLNRLILTTGWRGLRDKLDYKSACLIEVDPAHTSQTCHACGHVDAASRRSQSKFHCVRCGHEGNADVNAALNVMARGTGAAGRRGARALAPPKTRQRDMLRLAA